MNSTTYLFPMLLFISFFSNAQSDGYWDKERATSKHVVAGARERVLISSEDLPEGTTEVVYRISLLNQKQQVANSLISILKAIPDPTRISQGSAGAMALLSVISGEDKCKYGIFGSAKDANLFQVTGKSNKACFFQNTPVNNEVKRLTLASNPCLKTPILRFGFESENWILNQKIILEVVPWVNVKLSNGWNSSTKKELIALSKSSKVYPTLLKKEAFSIQFLQDIQQQYTFKEFTNLLPLEKKIVVETIIENALIKTGEIKKAYLQIRLNAQVLFEKGNFDEAIALLQSDIFLKNRAEPLDYYVLGNFYLLSKQFNKAATCINEGILKNPSEIYLQLALAHLYLFTNRISDAKEIHKKYKNQNIDSKTTWDTQTKLDLALFKKYNLPTADFKKILRILE